MQQPQKVTKEDLKTYTIKELKQYLIDNDTPISASYSGKNKSFFLSKALSVFDKTSNDPNNLNNSFASPKASPQHKVKTKIKTIKPQKISKTLTEQNETYPTSPEKLRKVDLIKLLVDNGEDSSGLSSYLKKDLVQLVLDRGLVRKSLKSPKRIKLSAEESSAESSTQENLFTQKPNKKNTKPIIYLTSPNKKKRSITEFSESSQNLSFSENFSNSKSNFDKVNPEISPSTFKASKVKTRPDSPLPKFHTMTPLKLTPKKTDFSDSYRALSGDFSKSNISKIEDHMVESKYKNMKSKNLDNTYESSFSSSLNNSIPEFDYSFRDTLARNEDSQRNSPHHLTFENRSVNNSYGKKILYLIITILIATFIYAFAKNLTFEKFCESIEDENCIPCPSNGLCTDSKLTCNSGFKKSGKFCVPSDITLDSAKRLANTISHRIRTLAGSSCRNTSPITLPLQSTQNLLKTKPLIFKKALTLIESNPLKYQIKRVLNSNPKNVTYSFSTDNPKFNLNCYFQFLTEKAYSFLLDLTKSCFKELISNQIFYKNRILIVCFLIILSLIILINYLIKRNLTKKQIFNRLVTLIFNKLFKSVRDNGNNIFPIEYLKDELFFEGDEVIWKEAIKEVLMDSRVVLTCEVIEGSQMDCLRLGEKVMVSEDYEEEEEGEMREMEFFRSPSKINRRHN